jgi:hypothetical protein
MQVIQYLMLWILLIGKLDNKLLLLRLTLIIIKLNKELLRLFQVRKLLLILHLYINI